MESTGDWETYKAAGWLGTLHRAVMTDLKPDTEYYYRVGSSEGWSNVFHFKTFPSGNDLNYTVAFVADMGYGDTSDPTVVDLLSAVDSGEIQLVIHSGDIGYADGFQPHWDDFFNKIQPIASRVPYMVTPGNHEFWYNFTAYKHRFNMPGVSSAGGSGDNMYYSWSLGPVFYLGINSETAIDTADINPEEQQWIIDQLAQVDRNQFPWIIAYFHRPMYCSNDGQCNKADSMGGLLRKQVEDTFMKYQVDVVITGHVHSYERTYPLYDDKLVSTSYADPTAPVYLVQGASGNREGNHGFPSSGLPAWSAAHSSDVGYALYTVSPSSFDWLFFAANALSLIHI